MYLRHELPMVPVCVIHVHPTIDPSATLRTPVRAGPNGADRVLGDKERRVMEIFLDYAGICPLFWIMVRIIDNKINVYNRITGYRD